MKKHPARQRTLALQKETIQTLTSTRLEAVAGGAPNSAIDRCLTVRTCASFEFSC